MQTLEGYDAAAEDLGLISAESPRRPGAGVGRVQCGGRNRVGPSTKLKGLGNPSCLSRGRISRLPCLVVDFRDGLPTLQHRFLGCSAELECWPVMTENFGSDQTCSNLELALKALACLA